MFTNPEIHDMPTMRRYLILSSIEIKFPIASSSLASEAACLGSEYLLVPDAQRYIVTAPHMNRIANILSANYHPPMAVPRPTYNGTE